MPRVAGERSSSASASCSRSRSGPCTASMNPRSHLPSAVNAASSPPSSPRTREPANATAAPASPRMTSAPAPSEAHTPPVVGWRTTHTWGTRAAPRSTRPRATRCIWISDRIPSCIRAPPELSTETSGRRSLRGHGDRLGDPPALGLAHRAAHEGEVEGHQDAGTAADQRASARDRLLLAGALACALEGRRITRPAQRVLGERLPGERLEGVDEAVDRARDRKRRPSR